MDSLCLLTDVALHVLSEMQMDEQHRFVLMNLCAAFDCVVVVGLMEAVSVNVSHLAI